jgi:hypothetical protein
VYQQNYTCNKKSGALVGQALLHSEGHIGVGSSLHSRVFIHKVGDYDQVNN